MPPILAINLFQLKGLIRRTCQVPGNHWSGRGGCEGSWGTNASSYKEKQIGGEEFLGKSKVASEGN
jgi:hypothetical protein